VVIAAASVLFSALLGFEMDNPVFMPKWRGIELIATGLSLWLIAFTRNRLSSRTALRVLTTLFVFAAIVWRLA
jgi:hypothetical protein